MFWKTEVFSKLYYVRSADENVGGSVGVFLFCFRDSMDFLLCVMEAGRPELEGVHLGVAFKVLVCVGIY